MRVENPNARQFYQEECIKSNWSTRALERQIHVFYYERLLASRDSEALAKVGEENTTPLPISPRDFAF
jgi:predicted nuclease of restriction endonuclease-like (RecB) superfamily